MTLNDETNPDPLENFLFSPPDLQKPSNDSIYPPKEIPSSIDIIDFEEGHSFGLQPDVVGAIDIGDDIDLDLSFASDQWLEGSEPYHSDASGPSSHDIICGSGKFMYNHPGSVRFRKIVKSAIPHYTAANTRSLKSIVIDLILQRA